MRSCNNFGSNRQLFEILRYWNVNMWQRYSESVLGLSLFSQIRFHTNTYHGFLLQSCDRDWCGRVMSFFGGAFLKLKKKEMNFVALLDSFGMALARSTIVHSGMWGDHSKVKRGATFYKPLCFLDYFFALHVAFQTKQNPFTSTEYFSYFYMKTLPWALPFFFSHWAAF